MNWNKITEINATVCVYVLVLERVGTLYIGKAISFSVQSIYFLPRR